MTLRGLPAAWTVWDHVESDRLILTYRPDVFDGSAFPAACLPTIYVREGERDPRHAGTAPAAGTEGTWTVTLFLEPEVSERRGRFETWDEAVEAAVDLATAFDAGEYDLRELYQLPREAYLDRLERLTG
ncbi:MAG: DUF5820 family protein [Halobacteriota archaeon]